MPVVFSLGSWNPTTIGFRDWLAGQLVRDHPGLAATGRDESNLAAALVEAGRILPVLDGFDELAAGLHRAALDALNATTLPLLLTSRPGEYATVAGTDALTAAAAVRLTDLTVTDLVDYLPRTTRRNAGATVWDPVLNELRDHPERPASVNLRAVLTTPLMVGLARAIYSDPAGARPVGAAGHRPVRQPVRARGPPAGQLHPHGLPGPAPALGVRARAGLARVPRPAPGPARHP